MDRIFLVIVFASVVVFVTSLALMTPAPKDQLKEIAAAISSCSAMISSNGEKHRASVPRLFRWISTQSSTIDEPHGDFDRRFSRKGFSATSPDEIVFLAIRKGLDLSVIRTGDLCTPAPRFGFERLD